MKRQVVYVQNGAAPDKPTVRISKTNEGVTFSVTSTGRSLTKARQRAEQEFAALARWAKAQEQA